MKFLLSRQAEITLDTLWDYYFERGGTRLADRILAEIFDAIARLIDHPGLGHLRLDLTDKPLRFYRVYSIFLIYDPASSPLYTARVYHTAQDVRKHLNQEHD
jgi:plasmid stabilization system protein ParE